MKLSLVLLTRNEVVGLKALFDRLPLSAVDEVFCVDGGSTDGTVEFLEAKGVRVHKQTVPGRGEAFRLAFERATGDALIFFGPDGNESPEDVTRFRPFLDAGYDMVIGNRMSRGGRNEEDITPFKFRKWANQAFTLLANVAWARGEYLSDTINGFRAITRKAWEKIAADGPGYTIEYQCSIRAHKLGLRVAEFPTNEGARIDGREGSPSISTGLAFLKLFFRELRARADGRSALKSAAIVALVCIAVRGVLLLIALPHSTATDWNNFVVEDSGFYFRSMDAIKRLGLWGDDPALWHWVRDRMPGYPLWLLGCEKVGAVLGLTAQTLAVLTNVLWYGAACGFLVLLVSFLSSAPVGFIAGLIMALEPAGITYSLSAMTEPMGIALWLAATYLAVVGAGIEVSFLLIASGAALGLATLTRPVFFLWEGVLVAAVLWQMFRANRRKALLRAALHVAVFAAVLAPWFARNNAVWGRPMLTPAFGNHLDFVYRPLFKPEKLLPELVEYMTMNQAQFQHRYGVAWQDLSRRNDILQRLWTENFRREPMETIRATVAGHWRLYIGTGAHALVHMLTGGQIDSPGALPHERERFYRYLYTHPLGYFLLATWAALLAIYVLAAIGLRGRLQPLTIFSLVTLAYFVCAQGALGHSRYRLPMDTAFATLAALGVVRVKAWLAARRSVGIPTAREIPASRAA